MKRTAIAALLLARAALPAAGEEPMPIPRHPSQLVFPASTWRPPDGGAARVELPGGPVVFFVEDHALPLFDVVAAARIGSFLDPQERPGVATLTTELLARGGTAGLGADAFDDAVERLGGRVAARSGATNSALGIDGPSWEADRLLESFFDLLSTPGFDPDRLQSLEANLREGMGRRNDAPAEMLEREWERLLYGEDHFSTRALTPADLDRIDRADLELFHRRTWRPENLILAVSGDLDRESFLARLRERLPPLQGPEEARALPWPPPAPGQGAPAGLYLAPRSLPQNEVLLGHRLLPAVAPGDRPAVALLAEVLGGSGAVSRIQGRLRTAEGLVYRSVTTIEPGELWPGDVRIFFETRPEGTERAVALVRGELERIRDQPVPDRELEVARTTLLAGLRTDFDTPEEVAGRLAENALFGRPDDHWPAWYDALEAVDADDVREAARRYLHPDELLVLVLGPVDERTRGELAKLLDAPVHVLPERDPATQEPLTPPAPTP